ncbi:hypothetical protein L7F22_046732 [Adiantum nelumboides]|nr:hypothetical protein [Adiantum nelumboides]
MASSSVHAIATNTALVVRTPISHDSSPVRLLSFSLATRRCFTGGSSVKGTRGGTLHASKLLGIEPDLPEFDDDYDYDTRTAGEGEEEFFPWGIADGHHTFHEEDANIDVWEAFKEPFIEAGGPTGFQAYLGWGALPIFYLMVFYGVQVEYIFLAAVLFIFAFVGIEMNKPDLDHEFPPEIYMERRKKRLEEQLAKETGLQREGASKTSAH